MSEVADSSFVYRSIETAVIQEILSHADLLVSQEVQGELFKNTTDRFESDKKKFEKKIEQNSEYQFLKDHLEGLGDIEPYIRLVTSKSECYDRRIDVENRIEDYEGKASLQDLAEQDASCFFLYKDAESESILIDDYEAYNEFIKDLNPSEVYCLAEIIIDKFQSSRQHRKLVKILYEEYIEESTRETLVGTLLEQKIKLDFLLNSTVS